MTDHATPNLPSRDFDATEAFYARLGFTASWKGGGWMILRRGGLTLEFFPWPDLAPGDNPCSACLRLDDLDAFYGLCRDAGIEERRDGAPRLQAPRRDPSGLTIGYLIDPDGTLLRLVQNPD